jgi:hypothetical protein
MATVPPDLLVDFAARVRSWKQDRDRLQDELKIEQEMKQAMAPEKVIQIAESYLGRHRVAIAEGARLSASCFDRIEPRHKPNPRGEIVRGRFRLGMVHVSNVERTGPVPAGLRPSSLKGTADMDKQEGWFVRFSATA